MNFSEFKNNDEPASDLFNKCMDIVFEGSDGNEEFIERISPEARFVYLLWSFDGEIHNGGFDQFFFNSIGDYAQEILSNLESLGASKSASLLKEAMTYFPDSKPSTVREERWKELEKYEGNEKFEEHLDNLDECFYEYEDKLTELLNQYVCSNSNATIKA